MLNTSCNCVMYVAKKYSFMLAWTWLCQIDACVSHSIAEVKLVVSGDLKHHVFWCSSYCVKNLSPPMAMHEHRYSKIRNLIQLLLVRRVPDKFRRQLLCFLQTEVTACYSVSGSMAVFFSQGKHKHSTAVLIWDDSLPRPTMPCSIRVILKLFRQSNGI